MAINRLLLEARIALAIPESAYSPENKSCAAEALLDLCAMPAIPAGALPDIAAAPRSQLPEALRMDKPTLSDLMSHDIEFSGNQVTMLFRPRMPLFTEAARLKIHHERSKFSNWLFNPLPMIRIAFARFFMGAERFESENIQRAAERVGERIAARYCRLAQEHLDQLAPLVAKKATLLGLERELGKIPLPPKT